MAVTLLPFGAKQGVVVQPSKTSAEIITDGHGDQDFIFPVGFGTPAAFKVFMSGGTVFGTEVSHIREVHGISHGTNHRMVNNHAQSGISLGVTNTGTRTSSTTVCDFPSNTGAITASCTFKEFGDRRVTLTWSMGAFNGHYITMVAWSGDGLMCHVGTVNTDAAEDVIVDENDILFEPDQLHTLYAAQGWGVGFRASAQLSVGMANNEHPGVVQRSFTRALGHNFSDVYNGGRGSTEYVAYEIDIESVPGSPAQILAVDYGGLEITAFHSLGFSITRRNGSGVPPLAYLALRFDGRKHWVGHTFSPTGTTPLSDDVTDPGFHGSGVVAMGAGYRSADMDITEGTAAVPSATRSSRWWHGAFAEGIASHAFSSQDGASATSNENAVSSDKAVFLNDFNGARSLEADLDTFMSQGWTLDWATNSFAGQVIFWSALEQDRYIWGFEATQSAPSAVVSLVQQVRITIGGTQSVPSVAVLANLTFLASTSGTQPPPLARADLALQFQLVQAATQSAPAALFQIIQGATDLIVSAEQSPPAAAFAAALQFRLVSLLVQSAPLAEFSLFHQAGFDLQIGATQGAPSALVLAELRFQLGLTATLPPPEALFNLSQGATTVIVSAAQPPPTATVLIDQVLDRAVSALQLPPAAVFELRQQILAFQAIQAAPSAAFSLFTASDITVAFAAVQSEPGALVALRIPVDGVHRTCFVVAYPQPKELVASYQVPTEIAATYPLPTELEASYPLPAELAATYPLPTELSGELDTC